MGDACGYSIPAGEKGRGSDDHLVKNAYLKKGRPPKTLTRGEVPTEKIEQAVYKIGEPGRTRGFPMLVGSLRTVTLSLPSRAEGRGG